MNNVMWFAAYIGIYVAGLLTPLWFFMICVVVYALLRPGYELVLIGVFIDAQFGLATPGFSYLYTTLIALTVLILELLKPQLSFYTDRNG